ncbi:hypothetical protein [Ktedonospora formicarum]|uniref:Uncharacterized protein n=1 Tax=Ktedonospora formicarum TaxID=2778364 RepID=A0A8J3I715_9CHLR|nr:hypothetical protein [Ktedonospora formicarum]GHO48601.1 hypothetical protein KSX_67640 [Ktedonospora formicarum]
MSYVSSFTSGRPVPDQSRVLEQYAERQALGAVRGATFTQCLLLHRLTPDLEVVDPRGSTHIIHGKNLSDERAWQKFLASLTQPLPLLSLTQSAEPLVKLYRTWLLTTYTQRYRWLTTSAQLQWFEQVTALVVVRKIMEAKHTAFTYEHVDAFADRWVALEMGMLLALGTMTIEIAKAIHHIVRQPEQAKELVEHLFDVQATRLRDRPQQIREALPPLPPLPKGTHLPLALLPTQSLAIPPASIQEKIIHQKETPHEPR